MVDAVVGAHDLAFADFDSLYIQPALASLAFRTAACIFILFYASYEAIKPRR